LPPFHLDCGDHRADHPVDDDREPRTRLDTIA